MSKETKYVVGIALDMNKVGRERVLLTVKERPKWQKGLLNGIGGHIEEGEEPIAAMTREFREEAGLATHTMDWSEFLCLSGQALKGDGDKESGDEFKVYFFASKTINIHLASTRTDESVDIWDVGYILKGRWMCIDNIPWIILLAIDHLMDGRPSYVRAVYPA